ncbi:hypothetical protein Q4Q35_04610 [Flavivirga aquimarina]|uniref:Lipoprotein n=1 Tax=Flavivirga aquimarina TaxID=2027862 RepID=A0ABT8W7P6_9FLAO|nr:hypothetical protein [Flavivirga aquimarina]MDO5969082.1 hypothetical protein [Flavivirga aquimarina]
MVPTLKNSLQLLLFVLLFISSCDKDEGVNVDLETVSVKIDSPYNSKTLPPNNPIEFVGKVQIEDPNNYSSLTAVWESDIDGILFESGIDSDGITKFTSKSLSQDIHRIRLYIYNLENDAIYDEAIVYNAIWLYEITNNSNSSKIHWSKNKDDDFEAYELYRSYSKYDLDNRKGTLIYTTTDQKDTTYIDTEAILGNKHYYRAFIKRKMNSPSYVGSNKDSIIPGNFIKLDYPLYKVIKDPVKNYAYGIVNVESIYEQNQTGYGLVFINTDEKIVEKRILNNIRFTDLDIDPSGQYLYLCSRSNLIHKVNLNSQDLDRTYNLTSTAHKIEVGSNRLYTHITPPTSGSTEFRIYDLHNQTNIPYDDDIEQPFNTLSFRHGDFELGENGTLYHGGSNSSGSTLSKISTENDIFSLTKEWNSNNYQRPEIILNHNKLYWNHLLIDTEINKLGEFNDNGEDINIQTVSPNGLLALGWRRLFKTEDQSIIKEIPVHYDIATFLENDYLLLIKNENPISNENNSILFFYDF